MKGHFIGCIIIITNVSLSILSCFRYMYFQKHELHILGINCTLPNLIHLMPFFTIKSYCHSLFYYCLLF